MITWGINALNHGSSIAVVHGGNLTYWSKDASSDQLSSNMIREAIDAGGYRGPETIAWYERPWLKKSRQAFAGQWEAARDLSVLPSRYIRKANLNYARVKYVPHHQSHAAAGFLTSPFEEAAVVVLDAIGEWECASIWHGKGQELKKVWSVSYPNSLGLFYSAFTKLVGYTPIKEEHLLQKLAESGNALPYQSAVMNYWTAPMRARINLHRGVWDWPMPEAMEDSHRADLAAAVQAEFEHQAFSVMLKAQRLVPSRNLVYMGGCAMNSRFNRKYLNDMWHGVWSLSDPGDGSSSIGAALTVAKCRVRLKENVVNHLDLKYNS
jgi:carbamoyltransferase